MTPANGVGQQVTVTPNLDGTFQYCVVATTASGCSSAPVCTNVIVNPLPVCSITGPDNICPASSNVYSAPAGMSQYTWTISGGATISSGAATQNVTVLAGNACGTYTLTLTITNANNCVSTCTRIITIADTQAPAITPLADITIAGCNGAIPAASIALVQATDNCGFTTITFVSDAAPTLNGCIETTVRTYRATDRCGGQRPTSHAA